jgi:flavin-dependent dehydrogenase
MSEVDAIAIGGGLAGAAFALELARNGVRVVVLERSRGPALKVCGDFLSAEALDLLAYLGLDAAGLGAVAVDKLTMASGGRAASASLPFRAAGLSRLILDETLLDLAAEAGARVERGIMATRLTPADGRAVVEAGGARFSARALALATGKHNLRGWPRMAGSVTAFKQQFALSRAARADLAGRVQLVLYDGGYVGASMVENDLATLCWQVETGILKRIGSDWRSQLDSLAGRSAALGDLLVDAKPVTPRPVAVAGLPFGYVRRQAIADSVFPIGDQIAVIPAFTGDGTSIALASGIRAAHAVLAGKTATDFQNGFARSLKHQFALARAVSALFRSAPTRRLCIGAIGIFPSIATRLAGATRLSAIARPGAS